MRHLDLRKLNEFLESVGIFNGEIGERFAVEIDFLFLEAVHERGIRHARGTHGGVDAHDPQTAKAAALIAAITICVGETLFVGFGRAAQQTAFAAPTTLDIIEQFSAATM